MSAPDGQEPDRPPVTRLAEDSNNDTASERIMFGSFDPAQDDGVSLFKQMRTQRPKFPRLQLRQLG